MVGIKGSQVHRHRWVLQCTSCSAFEQFQTLTYSQYCQHDWLSQSFSKPLCIADSKEGADSDLDKYLPEADVVITTPFHPGYINADRIAKAPKLKLALTAGIGSDHVDLKAAAEHGVTVAEITGGCGALLFGAHTYLGFAFISSCD